MAAQKSHSLAWRVLRLPLFTLISAVAAGLGFFAAIAIQPGIDGAIAMTLGSAVATGLALLQWEHSTSPEHKERDAAFRKQDTTWMRTNPYPHDS